MPKTFQPNVIIGNPPYNVRNHTKNNNSYSQIFQKFVEQGIAMKPNYESLIIPNRWFSGGKNLHKFRKIMLHSKHLQSIRIWNNSKDLFPDVSINGGVSYFVWNKSYNNTKKGINVKIYDKQKCISNTQRPLLLPNTDIFISDPYAVSILQKLSSALNKDNLKNHTSSSCPFALRPYFPKRSNQWHWKKQRGDIKCYTSNHKYGFVNKKVDLKMINHKRAKKRYIPLINDYKLIISRANGIGINRKDKINPIITKPKSICTETYIILGWDLVLNKPLRIQKQIVSNLKKYVETKFVRFLIGLHKSSQDAVKKVYTLVPMQNFTNQSDINWNASETKIDGQLFKKYNLTNKEIQHIEKTIHVQQ